MIRRFLLSLCVLAFVMAGCGGGDDQSGAYLVTRPPGNAPAPGAAAAAPQQLSPQQIAQKIISDAELDAALPPPGSTLPPGMAQTFLNKLQQVVTQHSATEEGQEALDIVSRRIESRVREVERAKLWHYVLVYADAHRILNPGSTKFNRQREKAQIELRRPTVQVQGFVEDGLSGQTIAFVDIHLPLQDLMYSERMRVGEEIHGVKLVDIIGNNRGVVMEFLESGETFEVLTKAAQ